MNQNLIQINDNYGAVTDEQGNIRIISKENNEYEFKDILIKENNLENLNSKLSTFKNELYNNKLATIFGEVANATIIIGEIIIYTYLNSTHPISALIIAMTLYYIPTKGINLVVSGSRISRHIKRKKLKTTIEELDEKISQLKQELQIIKEKAKYNINYSTFNEHSKSNTYIADIHHLSSYMSQNVNEEPKNIKVLCLKRK